MAISTAAVCLLLLGTLYLTEAAPVRGQGDLENLVKAAKYLYEGLSQAMYAAQIQEEFNPRLRMNSAPETETNGMDQNYHFHGEVNGMNIQGK